jgi:uncharacterized lipoprotein YehR (DUF1307 family)
MKRFIASLAVALVIAGCGSKQENVSINSSSVNTRTAPSPLVETTAPPSETPSSSPSLAATNTERPIEFTYLGIAPDKEHMHYKIKVLTQKKISQVDLGVKYMDEAGKVLDDTTLIWQNIVKSTRQPIENGKTYDVLDYLPEGTTKADVVLKRVVFDDGTYWNSKDE